MGAESGCAGSGCTGLVGGDSLLLEWVGMVFLIFFFSGVDLLIFSQLTVC